ncbi:MAG: ABC transporter ATP-binding protein, partial [Thermoguttaceae bacterium]|nr:ABC transporter ATP-binding protein [Thermoguttaceae bacterium]
MTELSVEKISFHYNKRPVLSEITFDTTGGTFLSLLGPNGSGKTTLLRCLNSILRPNSGMVRLNRQPVPKYTAAELARRVAFLPQRCEMSGLTVFESVLLGRKPFLTGWQATGADLERVDETLDRLELSSLALRPLYRLSGGELQRAAIARL